MPTGPEHFTEAERLIQQAAGWMDADLGWENALSKQERLAYRANDVAAAQVHATLALVEALSGRREPLVWHLDDSSESAEPDLYANRGAAVDAAERQYRQDNPFGAADLSDMAWHTVRDEEHATQLVAKGHETGIIVRGLRPKTAPAEATR